jgi:hypothetical protein
VAEFLGKRVDYIYEVRELEPGVRFVMGTREGHLPMETTYEWEDAPDGGHGCRCATAASRPASRG